MNSDRSEDIAEIQITRAPPKRWPAALELVFRRSKADTAKRQVNQALAVSGAAENPHGAGGDPSPSPSTGEGRGEGDAAHSGIHPSPPTPLPQGARGVSSYSPSPREESHQLPRSVVFEACRGEQLLGAIWVQRQPGRTASFEPARVIEKAVETPVVAEQVVQALMQQAITFAIEGGARMFQTLLETDVGTDARRLQEAGFQHAAELLYLVSDCRAFPESAPAESLEFEPLGPDTRPCAENSPVQLFDRHSFNRLAEIVQRTYVGTLDCPQLDGVRPIDEILEGYRAVGQFNSAHWLLVRRDGRDVGCLLLAEHAQGTWELVYMGLISGVRGHGWGLDVVRHAQWLARGGAAQRMVLAVDAKNAPAIAMYAAAGFETWDRRSAWLKIL